MKGNGYWLAGFSALGVYLAPLSYSWLFGFIGLGGILLFRPAKPKFLMVCFILYTTCSLSASLQPETPPAVTSSIEIEGTVTTSPLFEEKYTSFIIQDEETKQKWSVFLFTSMPAHSIQIGSTCSFTGKVERHAISRNPGEFDYELFMLYKGIRGTIIADASTLGCLGSGWYAGLFTKRQQMLDYIDDTLSPYVSSWVKALVLGDDRYLDEKTVVLFQKWGLSHLLAISGLHVGLCIAFFSYLSLRLSLLTKRKLIFVLMFLLPMYIFLAGGAPSVIRAVCMAEIAMFLSLIKQKWPMTDSISFLFCSVLLLNPSLIHQLGFQFSFLVTFGILVSRKWIESSQNPFETLLRLSLLCQLIVLPLQVHSFYLFNPLSLLANLLFVPVMSVFLLPFCLVLVASIFGLPSSIIQVLNHTFHTITAWLIRILKMLDETMYVEWVIGQLSFISIVIFVVMFVGMMVAWERSNRRRAFLFGIGLSVALMCQGIAPYIHSPGRVAMLDVGQGDCFIIEWPNRQHIMMIDAAGVLDEENDETFTRIIQPYLHERGIQKVDTLVLSHADQDHIGAAEEVLQAFGVDTVLTSPYFKGELPVGDVMWEKVKGGDRFVIEETRFDVLYPIKESQDKNENSIVMKFEMGGWIWMFTGDVGKEGETEMVRLNPELDVDILKVGHHGSDTSTGEEWLKAITPEVALISSGVDNQYGHPHDSVINRLNKEGVKMIRTDQKGAVIFQFSKGTGTFYSHLP